MKYEKISDKKMTTPIEILCKGFPPEFVSYFQVFDRCDLKISRITRFYANYSEICLFEKGISTITCSIGRY